MSTKTESTSEAIASAFSIERVKTILFGEVTDNAHEPDIVNQLLVAVVVLAIIMIIASFVKLIATTILNQLNDSPWVIEHTHDAKIARRVLQNPNSADAIPLRRSSNETHKNDRFT